MTDPTYLGDSVYADVENGYIVLTTRNGIPTDPSNIIYLDTDVFAALIEYAKEKGLLQI